MTPTRKITLAVRDLGRIGYGPAWTLQQRLHADVVAGREPSTVLMLEHDPVITVTARDGIAKHLLSQPEALKREGIDVVETNRGGDITYHGPGQLVAYPIVALQPLGLNVRRYVAALEDAIIEMLGAFGVVGRRDPAGIGVWVEENPELGIQNSEQVKAVRSSMFHTPSSAKIAAIGVRVRRWVTLHGLAINVTTDLEHFRHIVPCGLPKPVTSLGAMLDDRCPSMAEVKSVLGDALRSRFG